MGEGAAFAAQRVRAAAPGLGARVAPPRRRGWVRLSRRLRRREENPPEGRLSVSDVLAASRDTAARQPCGLALTGCPLTRLRAPNPSLSPSGGRGSEQHTSPARPHQPNGRHPANAQHPRTRYERPSRQRAPSAERATVRVLADLPPPWPGDVVTLSDGRRARVDTANLDGDGLHRRKLTVIVEPYAR